METTDVQLDAAHAEVREYDPQWVLRYQEEAQRIKDLLGDKIVKIEHIGSTAVPGLASKPIIDMAVLAPSWKGANDLIEPLATLGYPFDLPAHEATGGTERHLFRKGNPTESHLSIAYADRGSFLERQILFRDYLRAHDDARDAYAQLKKDSIKRDPTGKSGYIGAKTDFVMGILKKAGFQNPWFDLSKH
ncbi:MAG TPA: GrpB family protein [Candidatus Paceibacterota bacterium]